MSYEDAWLKRLISVDERARRMLRIAIAAILTIAVFAAAVPSVRAAVPPQDPIEQARGLVQQAIAILENPHLTLQEERRQLRALAEPYFDFEGMARSTLGYHWRTLTPGQREQFVALFTAFMEDAALSKIQEYSGQRVEFTRETPIADGYMQVQGHAMLNNGSQPIPIGFMCHQIDGSWKVYDLTVDNISVMANYRNQFNRVINDQGFDHLMAVMKQKQLELAEMLGNKRENAAVTKPSDTSRD
jgi:phospholipid transport system substrate-binding protein